MSVQLKTKSGLCDIKSMRLNWCILFFKNCKMNLRLGQNQSVLEDSALDKEP